MAFSFPDRFSETMEIVARVVIDTFGQTGDRAAVRILDIPAGAGKLTTVLREQGFSVTASDINRAQDDYVYSDMTKRLPFADGSYDVVICLEGIEHIPNPVDLINELSRITKPGGTVILSTPNISSMYSRFTFLFTGFFFMFRPEEGYVNTKRETEHDYWHISPMTWNKILFHFAENGFDLSGLYGNKMKRKLLLPFYLLALLIGYPWQKLGFRKYRNSGKHLALQTGYYTQVRENAQSYPALFSRNIVLAMKKKEETATP